MTFRRWLLGSLVVVSAGCGPVQEELPEREKSPAQVQAEKLAQAQGFDLREVTLVEAPGGAGSRHELRFQGIPLWGLGAKTAQGVTSLTNVRFEPAARVETKPRLTQAQAEAAALAALDDTSGRVEEVQLVLVPREERRRRPGAPASGRLNAEHYERVVTDLTLSYRVLLSTGEPGDKHGWTVQVDARSGQVLRKDSLNYHQTAPTYRKVYGYGYYEGTTTLNVLYNSTTSPPYSLQDTRGNTFRWTLGGTRSRTYPIYTSIDTRFGNGLLYSSTSTPDSINGETAAVDAYYAVNMTWNFYETLLGRAGPSGTGKGMEIRLHYPDANAFYNPFNTIEYIAVGYDAFPATGVMRPLSTTDIIGHELGHPFFMRELAGNPAQFPRDNGEQNGLNEGSGHISGFMAELSRDTVRSGRALLNIDQTPLQQSNLLLGELADPYATNLLTPTLWQWFNGIGLEEEHAAAGPFARMFLLLAYGCQPTPAGGVTSGWHCELVPQGFTGVGPLTASRIWARMVEQLPLGADYAQARQTALTVASGMDGYVGGPLMRKVALAFAAINVGSAPESNPPQTTLSCRQLKQDIECTGTITDVGSPNPPTRAPVLVLDSSQTYTLPGWQFTYVIPGASLAGGNHTVQLKAWDLWDNEATRTVTVPLDKTPPQATLFRSGLPKQPYFLVEASDTSGILSVDFLIGGQFVAGLMAPPYGHGFDTSAWTDGVWPLAIKVYDSFWNITTLNVPLQVDNTPPSVLLAVDPGGPPFNITASVSDASPVVRVDFKVDGVVFATFTNSSTSYTAQYTPLDPLAHNLFVEVTDAFGNQRVVGQAAPMDTGAPEVSVTVEQTATTVKLHVSVSDSCGIQYPYSLYLDGALKAQPSTPTFMLDLGTSVDPGQHQVQVVVRDGCGNTANHQTTFTKSASPPVITGITRDDTQPKRPKFTVACTDTEGVKHVELRENGVILQSDTTAPYEFVVDTTARQDGDYPVLFQCSDIHGVPSSPETRTVTADNTGPSITHFSVYGSGRSYLVQASAADLRGIQSVTLAGGLVGPSFNVTRTVAPYAYQWVIPTTTSIQTDFPFSVTARDRWGNESSLFRWCYVNTSSTVNAYLSCHL